MWRPFFAVVGVCLGIMLAGCPTDGGPETLTVSPATLQLEVGQSAPLTPHSSATPDTFTWSSDRIDVATVSTQGRVTAVAVGTAQITLTSGRTDLTDTATVTVAENLPPSITIGEPSAAATRQGPVTYTVTYEGAADITLAAADITLNTTGTATAVLGEPVTTGEGVRSIPIDTIAGDGTLSIAIAAATATDSEGNAAPAAGPSSPVTVDNTVPTLEISAPSVSTTNTGPVDYLVNYTGADAITLSKTDVLVNGTGTVAATLAEVAETSASERTVSFSSIDGDGTLGISIAAATAADQAGNTAAAAGPSGEVVVDNTPPTATISAPSPSTTNNGPLTFRVTYEGASAITLAESDLQINGSAGVVAVLDEIEATSDTVRTIRFSTVAGDGTLGISLAAGTATDAAGNLAPAAGPSATATVDNTAPTITIGAPSTTNTSAGPIVFPVTYEGAKDVTLKAADVTLNRTGSANAQVTDITHAEGGRYDVTLGSVIGNGTVGISLAAATATDAAGNAAPAAGPSATAQVENTGPTLLIGPPSTANTFEESVAYTITYADATAVTLAPADITLNSPDGVTATIAVTGSGATERTVTLSAFSGLGEVTISIAANTAQDGDANQAPAAGPSAPFRVNPLLQPGSGFTGPTPQPDPIGEPGAPGIDAKAIARWDVVPYQTFDGYFEIGVVAFHINDIDRVEFSVEGGPWQAVREMTLNPLTDVVEYWIGLDARDFEDGPIEVRAVAYPKVGVPRVLGGEDVGFNQNNGEKDPNGEHSLFLVTNAEHSIVPERIFVSLSGNDTADGTREQPLATIDRALRLVEDGGEVILLDAGTYSISTSGERVHDYWITLRPADGLSADDVVIRCPGEYPDWTFFRQSISRLKWIGVSFDFGSMSQYYAIGRQVWFDKCIWYDKFGWANDNSRLQNVRGSYYATDSLAHDMLYGFIFSKLVRGCDLERISGDVFQMSKCVLDCRVTNVDGLLLEHHTDVYQMWGPADNLIVYGLQARQIADTQAIFMTPTVSPLSSEARTELSNSAFVNCNIESLFNFSAEHQENGGPPFSQMTSKFSHILFRDVKLGGQQLILRVDVQNNQFFEARDVLFKRVELHPRTWTRYGDEANWPVGVRFESCYVAGSKVNYE